MAVKRTDFSRRMRFDFLTQRLVWNFNLLCDYIVNKDYIGMHEVPLKAFKTVLASLSVDLRRPRTQSKPPHSLVERSPLWQSASRQPSGIFTSITLSPLLPAQPLQKGLHCDEGCDATIYQWKEGWNGTWGVRCTWRRHTMAI